MGRQAEGLGLNEVCRATYFLLTECCIFLVLAVMSLPDLCPTQVKGDIEVLHSKISPFARVLGVDLEAEAALKLVIEQAKA